MPDLQQNGGRKEISIAGKNIFSTGKKYERTKEREF